MSVYVRRSKLPLKEVLSKGQLLISADKIEVMVDDPDGVIRDFGLELEGLVISDKGSWHVLYASGGSMLQELELKVKTLRRIEDGLGALEDRYGVPGSFGQYAVRVADVLGIKSFRAQGLAHLTPREAVHVIDHRPATLHRVGESERPRGAATA